MKILICESCDFGYPLHITECPYCQAPSMVAHTSEQTGCFDVECYRDYFLVAFDTGEYFEMFQGQELDKIGLLKTLTHYVLIGFNSINYDLPIITLALSGCTNEELKEASDDLIVRGFKHWELLKKWGVKPLPHLAHIDMIEVAPGQASLKMYMAKLHAPKLQDLPFDPGMTVGWPESVLLREYCFNDVLGTRLLYETFPEQLNIRDVMSNKYGIDLRSKSDAQIAEAIFKKELPFTPERKTYPAGFSFKFRCLPWMRFKKLPLLGLINGCDFKINESGSVALPEELTQYRPTIGNSTYTIGIGGLHSNESNVAYKATNTRVLLDYDVASYYPAIILNSRIEPEHLKGQFSRIYKGWFDDRLEAKRAGDKKAADMKKIVLNGTFGKMGSWYSIFYAPTELLQTTLTGQIGLLMVIENLESCGIPVISANTDGVVLHPLKSQLWLVDLIISEWESLTGFSMEKTEYSAVYSRDVNSYVAVGVDGRVKAKGAFAPPVPVGGSWPAPTSAISNTAVINYLAYNVPVEHTIRKCTDIRQFINVRKVTGGGWYSEQPHFPKTLPKYRQAEYCAAYKQPDYESLLAWVKSNRRYLGKTVRWYYGRDSVAHIQTPGGGIVATSEGCVEAMRLPDSIPLDLDYRRYILMAKILIKGFNS